MTTRLRLAVVAVALCSAGCSGGTPGDDGPARTDGPLTSGGEHGSIVRGPVGTRITDGFELLLLEGHLPATIVSVRSVGGEDGLRILGALVAGPERHLGAHAQLRGFPPKRSRLGTLVDAEGAEILPRDDTPDRIGYELLVGYEVTEDDKVAVRTHLEVIYRVDGVDYLHRPATQLVYCPDAMTGDECFEQASEHTEGGEP